MLTRSKTAWRFRSETSENDRSVVQKVAYPHWNNGEARESQELERMHISAMACVSEYCPVSIANTNLNLKVRDAITAIPGPGMVNLNLRQWYNTARLFNNLNWLSENRSCIAHGRRFFRFWMVNIIHPLQIWSPKSLFISKIIQETFEFLDMFQSHGFPKLLESSPT